MSVVAVFFFFLNADMEVACMELATVSQEYSNIRTRWSATNSVLNITLTVGLAYHFMYNLIALNVYVSYLFWSASAKAFVRWHLRENAISQHVTCAELSSPLAAAACNN